MSTGLQVSTRDAAKAAAAAQQTAEQAGGYVAEESVGTGPQSLTGQFGDQSGGGAVPGVPDTGGSSGSGADGSADGVVVGPPTAVVQLPQPSNANDAATQALLVLRVPPQAVATVTRELAGAGTVVYQTSVSTDVTEQVADVASRVASEQSSIAELRTLMNKASSLSDVITLEQALSERESDLESLEAQQRALANEVDLATITVGYYTPTGVAVVRQKPAPKRAAFIRGLDVGWRGLVTAGRTVAAVAGWLAPFAVVVAVLWWPVRRLRKEAVKMRGRRLAMAGGGGGVSAGSGSVTASGAGAGAGALEGEGEGTGTSGDGE